MLGSAIRAVLMFVGAYLVSKGYVTSDFVKAIDPNVVQLVGLLGVIGSAVAGQYSAYKKKQTITALSYGTKQNE